MGRRGGVTPTLRQEILTTPTEPCRSGRHVIATADIDARGFERSILIVVLGLSHSRKPSPAPRCGSGLRRRTDAKIIAFLDIREATDKRL